MSVMYCETCGECVDTDYNVEHFTDDGACVPSLIESDNALKEDLIDRVLTETTTPRLFTELRRRVDALNLQRTRLLVLARAAKRGDDVQVRAAELLDLIDGGEL